MIPLLIVLLLLSNVCIAGPWPRGAGNNFVSLSYEAPYIADERRPYTSLYFEYGLTDRWTMGLDAGADLDQGGSALVFLRHAVFRQDRPVKVAAELAFGVARAEIDQQLVLRPGLTIGRSFSMFGRNAWVTLDTFISVTPKQRYWLGKAEGTLGVNLAGDSKLLFQLTTEKSSLGNSFHSIGVGGAYQISPGFHLISGLVQKSHSSFPDLKVGLWYSF